MRIAIQVILTFILMFWPMVLFTSVMMFDAPDSTENVSRIAFVIAILFYPVLIGLGIFIFGFPLWGIAPKHVLIATIVVPILGVTLFGYPKMLMTRLAGLPTQGYFVKDGKVYYSGDRIDAEAVSFEMLKPMSNDRASAIRTRDLGRDSKSVYYRGKVIAGADAATFGELDGNAEYYRDKSKVYHEGKELAGADGPTFEILLKANGERSTFARDKNRVYLSGRALEGLQGAKAKVLGVGYVVDGERANFYSVPLKDVDVATLTPDSESESIATDARSVFFDGQKLAKADPKTFKRLERSYGTDGKHVFYLSGSGSIVEGADPETFVVTNWDEKTQSEAKDRHGLYIQGRRIEAKK